MFRRKFEYLPFTKNIQTMSYRLKHDTSVHLESPRLDKSCSSVHISLNHERGWSGGAKGLGKLTVPGRCWLLVVLGLTAL